MKMFFCKCVLWVVERLLGGSDQTAPADADGRHGKQGNDDVRQSVAVKAMPLETVVLIGGGLDGQEYAAVPVGCHAVLVLRDLRTELWWTYERLTAADGGYVRSKAGAVQYGKALCVGQTGMALLRKSES